MASCKLWDITHSKVRSNGLFIEEIPTEFRDEYICRAALDWARFRFKTNDAKVRSEMYIRIKNSFPKKVTDARQEIKDIFALVGIIISDRDTEIADSCTAEQMVERFIMRQPEPDNTPPYHIEKKKFRNKEMKNNL